MASLYHKGASGPKPKPTEAGCDEGRGCAPSCEDGEAEVEHDFELQRSPRIPRRNQGGCSLERGRRCCRMNALLDSRPKELQGLSPN